MRPTLTAVHVASRTDSASPLRVDRDFHIAGESYAGRYIPLFADYIRKQNEHADERGLRKINLVSTLIGNGL